MRRLVGACSPPVSSRNLPQAKAQGALVICPTCRYDEFGFPLPWQKPSASDIFSPESARTVNEAYREASKSPDRAVAGSASDGPTSPYPPHRRRPQYLSPGVSEGY